MVVFGNIVPDRKRLQAQLARRLSVAPVTEFVRLLLSANPSRFDVFLLVAGTVAAVLGGMPFPMLGLIYGKLIDDFTKDCSTDAESATAMGLATQQKVLGIFGVALANFTMIYAYNGLWGLFGERLVYRIRFAYMRALLRQEPAYFHGLPSGEMAARLDADMATIQTGTGEKVAIYITSMSYFFTAYAVAFSQDAVLTFKMSLLVPVYIVFAQYSGRYLESFTKLVDEGVQSATSLAAECLHNIPLVHAYGAAEQFEELFAKRLQQVAPAVVSKTLTAAGQLGFLSAACNISNALAIWQGSRHIALISLEGGHGGFGQVFTVMSCVLDASLVFAHISHFFTFFIGAHAAYGNLLPVLRRKSKIDGTDEDAGVELGVVRGEIELRNVSFRYPSRPETVVVNSVSLDIPAGKTTAIVGLSGSGKSTIATLINRVYDVAEGQIFLDGRDVREWNVQSLRRSIAVVEQEPILMNCSILENVAHGLVGRMAPWPHWPAGALEEVATRVRKGQSLKEAVSGSLLLGEIIRRVEKALKQAQAYDFVVKLEHGMATAVGSRGSHISGGQRQRIAIARALAGETPILVMDEATSALDTATETAIQQGLATAYEGRTVIMIAHRLSSIKHVDKVVVMSEGNVVEEGGYRELIAADGAFARLVALQAVQHSRPGDLPPALASSSAAAEKEILALDEDDDADAGTSLLHETKTGAEDNEKEAVSKAPYGRVFGQLREYTRPRRSVLFVGLATACFIGISSSIEAVLMGGAVGSFTGCHTALEILATGRRLGFYFLGIGLLIFAANVATSHSFSSVAEDLLLKLRVLSLRSLLAQDMQWHEAPGRTPSGLLSYLSADATSLSNITGNMMGISLTVIVGLLVGPILAHIIAWKIALVVLLVVPIEVAAGVWRSNMVTKFQNEHREAFDSSVRIASEAVGAINTVAAYGLEGEMLAIYRRALRKPYNATVRLVVIGNFFLALGFSIPNALTGVTYWWGAKFIIDGTYTPAQFFLVHNAMMVGASGVGQLFTLVTDFARATIAGGRVFDLIALLPRSSQQDLPSHTSKVWSSENEEGDLEAVPLEHLSEKQHIFAAGDTGPVAVSMHNVHFSYPSRPNTLVLKGINISIKPGQTAAFVGPSGSGKSTIFSLLERFYRPQQGSIIIGGSDITKTDDTVFREKMSLVPQTNMVFDATVTYNLNLGAVGHSTSQARIEEAAQRANVHDVILSLPQAYNTPCGANGKSFSGGQRQRLSLARALVREPSLLLLDEPTSALDSESEARWQSTLEGLRGKSTILIIAHRLHTIQMADVIFLVEEGRVVDRGTHGELVERNERYRENVLQQVLE